MNTHKKQFHDKNISVNTFFRSYRKNFVGTQKQVQISNGKCAIGVQV